MEVRAGSTALRVPVSIREAEGGGGEGTGDTGRANDIVFGRFSTSPPIGWLISLTLTAAAAHLAPVELWVMKPEFTNREINTWLPGQVISPPFLYLNLCSARSHLLRPPASVTLVYSPRPRPPASSICSSGESQLPTFPVYLLMKERAEPFYSPSPSSVPSLVHGLPR